VSFARGSVLEAPDVGSWIFQFTRPNYEKQVKEVGKTDPQEN
jgi:hypothetical protein